MRYVFLLLFWLTCCQPAHAGYTVIIREQIAPKYILVQVVGKTEAALNPGPLPIYPPSVTRQICTAADLYSATAVDRAEVWEDPAGAASSPDLFAACPQIRAAKEREIRSGGSLRLNALANPYSAEERETWATQQREARSWLLDNNADVPMVFAMATVRGLSVEAMVGLIMENVALFEFASGYILGQQQRLLDLIAMEADFVALLDISWPPDGLTESQ